MEITIGDVAAGGEMVARVDGRVVFVSDALPGETVRVRITEEKKSFARAETLEVLNPSPERRPHIWHEASVDREPQQRVGGAEFGHTTPQFARELKRRILVDSLRRFGGIEQDVVVEPLPGGSTGWRTRLTLHVDGDGRVGPYAARSHRIVEVASLPLAFADIAERALKEIAAGSEQPGAIDFVAPSDGEVRLRRRPTSGAARPVDTVVERVHERKFRVDEDGFWQVHRFAAHTLFDAVQAAVDRARFDPEAMNLDLYGGVGLFAAALAQLVRDAGGKDARVETVELAARASAHARKNLADLAGVTAIAARVDRYLKSAGAEADAARRASFARGTVVLDPPRAGAKRDVVDALAALRPAQIVYVACDPVALARDTALLRGHGYELAGLRAFDLFPATHHVEAVATFVR